MDIVNKMEENSRDEKTKPWPPNIRQSGTSLASLLSRERRGGEWKKKHQVYGSIACGPRFPYLSFPNAYVLLGRDHAEVHDKAGKGGITEGTNNVMYYT